MRHWLAVSALNDRAAVPPHQGTALLICALTNEARYFGRRRRLEVPRHVVRDGIACGKDEAQ
jgi:hypothetical protein